MVRTVMSFLGIINVGEAHCDDDCLFSTPILSSLFISFIRVAFSNESSFSCCDGSRWEQLSFTISGRFALSYLASNISITLLVAFRVLTGSCAWTVLCYSVLVTRIIIGFSSLSSLNSGHLPSKLHLYATQGFLGFVEKSIKYFVAVIQ